MKLIVLLLVLVAVVAAAALFWIDSLAARGIEKGGRYALGVETKAKGVDLSLLYGKLTMDELNIGNPAGDFETPHLMKFGRFDVDVKTRTIFSDTIELDHFTIADLDINIEESLTGGNASAVVRHVKEIADGRKPSDGDQPEPSDEEGAGGKKVRVDRVEIGNVTVRFKVSLIGGLGRDETFQLGMIELTDVATDGSGVPVEELIRRIVPRILIAVLDKSGDKLPGDMRAATEILRKVLEALKVE